MLRHLDIGVTEHFGYILNAYSIGQTDRCGVRVAQTGCDGIMIGRGAEGNPWIFKQILHYMQTGETLARPTQHEVKEMMLRHARMQVEYKGGAIGIREMRKHVAWYTAGFPHSAKLRAAINQVESLQALEQMLNEWERG